MVLRFGHLTGFVLVAWLRTATAAEPADAFEQYLTSAAVLHESLDFEQALAALDRAKAVATTPHQFATVALWRGVVLADRNAPAAAEAAFREGLSIEIDAKLPTAASPKIERELETLRASLRRLVPRAASPGPPALEVDAAPQPAPRGRALAAVLTASGVAAGGASLAFGLLIDGQVQRAHQASYMFDAQRPAHDASLFATTSLICGIAGGALLTAALIAWVVGS